MPKQSPYYLKRPESKAHAFVFSDKASNPDNAFEVKLRTLTTLDVLSYLEKAEEYVRKFVSGEGEEGKAGYAPPINLPPVDNEPLFVTPSTCRVLACIEMAQVQPVADRYNFMELAAMTAVPAIQQQMLEAYAAVQPSGEAETPFVAHTDSSSPSVSESSTVTQS